MCASSTSSTTTTCNGNSLQQECMATTRSDTNRHFPEQHQAVSSLNKSNRSSSMIGTLRSVSSKDNNNIDSSITIFAEIKNMKN